MQFNIKKHVTMRSDGTIRLLVTPGNICLTHRWSLVTSVAGSVGFGTDFSRPKGVNKILKEMSHLKASCPVTAARNDGKWKVLLEQKNSGTFREAS